MTLWWWIQGPHFLCWISGVVPFNKWLISSWEENKCCYKLSKCTKGHLFHSKWPKLSFWVKIVVILSFQELKDTGITFICISLDSNDDSVMRLVNVFCFPFHSAPTAKIYPRELIASSRGVRINLQKVPLFGHFRQRCW